MADPSGLDDLEAELRRMEEELAALKGKKPDKKAKKPKETPAPEPAPAPPAEEPKKRFGLPKFGRKAEPAEAIPVEAPPAPAETVPLPAAVPPPMAVPLPTSTPSGRWTREGRTWVLRNPPREPVHLRRVLDADGRVVREEPAPPEMFAPRPVHREETGPVEAPLEPAADKPLHTLAEKLGGKRKKGLFGRKKDE